jgi:hypothetical protein
MRLEDETIAKIKEQQSRYRKVPLLRLWFKLDRWPWQYKTHTVIPDVGGKEIGEKWGWGTNLGGMGRFGGGWCWKLGIQASGTLWIIDLIWGSIHFTTKDPEIDRQERAAIAEQVKRALERKPKFDPSKVGGGDGSVPF